MPAGDLHRGRRPTAPAAHDVPRLRPRAELRPLSDQPRRHDRDRGKRHRARTGDAESEGGDGRDAAPAGRRDGRVRASARRRHAGGRHAVRAGGLRRRGVADRRSGAEGRHARAPVRAGRLGPKGSRLERVATRRLAEPGREKAVRTEVLADADEVARACAILTVREAQDAVAARGRFIMAVSGGHTPWKMLRALADEAMPWPEVHIVQVDERVAPAGHPDRNLTHLQESLLAHCPLRPEQVHAMPVEASDVVSACRRYAATLQQIAGAPPVLDLAHLGLGPDGHTASLVPGDPVLDVTDEDVGVTGLYQGRRRMTLTFSMLDRARRIVWLVTGSEKAQMLVGLCGADRSIPAGRIRQNRAVVLADRDAAARLVLQPTRTPQ